jgi:hypothetical protein
MTGRSAIGYQGEVHDERQRRAAWTQAMRRLGNFCQFMLNGGAPILRPATIELFTQRESTSGHQCSDGSSAVAVGQIFFSAFYGHLGYTDFVVD